MDISWCTNTIVQAVYIHTQGNYGNVQDWVNKMGIDRTGKWATDLEVFATSLLFNIDIWVYLGHFVLDGLGFLVKVIVGSVVEGTNFKWLIYTKCV